MFVPMFCAETNKRFFVQGLGMHPNAEAWERVVNLNHKHFVCA